MDDLITIKIVRKPPNCIERVVLTGKAGKGPIVVAVDQLDGPTLLLIHWKFSSARHIALRKTATTGVN